MCGPLRAVLPLHLRMVVISLLPPKVMWQTFAVSLLRCLFSSSAERGEDSDFLHLHVPKAEWVGCARSIPLSFHCWALQDVVCTDRVCYQK